VAERGRWGGVLALALVLVVTGLLWRREKVGTLDLFDQPFYLGIAHDVVHFGRFTDGYRFAPPGWKGVLPSGMRFAPLYPGIVAAAAELDGGLRRGMDCVVDSAQQISVCPGDARSVRWLQFFELAGFLWLVWWMGGAVGGRAVGWVSLVLALGTAPLLLRSVNFLMTEMTCLLWVTSAMAAGIKALRGRKQAAWSACAGVLLGMAALTRPGFLYLIPACALAALFLGRWASVRPALAMLGSAALVMAPWILRNIVVIGHAALTYGYDSHTLVQRIAFDTMTRREYALSFVCWLPDGNEIGRGIAGKGACDRFGWDEHETSFYVLGLRHMLYETLAASGGYEHHLGYLVRSYIFRMPIKHVLVSIPLALRGAYVAHWWGFVLFIVCVAWTVRGFQNTRSCFDRLPFLVMALPAWFMLALNSAVAVNQVRYNLMLIPAYAVAGALSIRALAERRAWIMGWRG
jgi:4-amino-4-deoxy-L-arabinose transferase-like glycosyltransferase